MSSTILVGLSGGVDSLSVALFLKNKGYEVKGLMLEMIDDKTLADKNFSQLKEYAKPLGIEVFREDIRKEFQENVIEFFCKSYIDGITPNICVHCNENIKIPYLLAFKEKYGCDLIATGHYARIRKEGERFVLYQAFDTWKDQSYMLHRLSQEQLSQIILPLGEYKKEDIKTFMRDNGFEVFANKRESFSICFTQDKKYTDFLLEKHPELSSLKNGEIHNNENKTIGYHNGYPFYTIGQYKGLSTNSEEKLYINNIIPQTNTLIVGDKVSCYVNELCISGINYIKYQTLQGEYYFDIKIRGKDEGTKAKVFFNNDNARIVFETPVFAPTKGQSIVIYENNDVVCGGEIESFVNFKK